MKRQLVVCLVACVALWGCGGGDGSIPPPVDTPTEKAPGAPEELEVTPGDGQVTVNWKAPAQDGGRPVTSYTLVVKEGAREVKSPSTQETSAVIDGLTNGTEYSFSVKATNAVGTGAASRSVSAVPRAVPGLVAELTAEELDQSVLLTWQAPPNGGSAILTYTVTCSPGDLVLEVPGSETQARVTGLTNGDAYVFTVRATNAAGDGPISMALTGVRPKSVPGAVTQARAEVFDSRISMIWLPPEDDGGRPLTGYTVTILADGREVDRRTTDAQTISVDATELTNGVEYSFVVTADNEVGSGPATTVRETPYTTPGVPTSLVVTGGNAQVHFAWTAAAANGRPILDYTVVVYQVQTGIPAPIKTVMVPGTDTETTVSVANGYYYQFTVQARNIAGRGPVSERSSEDIVWTTPSAPVLLLTAPLDRGVSLTWQRPQDNGGDTVFRYILRAYSDGVLVSQSEARGEATSGGIGGLINGMGYHVTVAAVNRAGEGAESNLRWEQAMDVPAPPTEVTAEAGNGMATVRWTEPEYDGGGEIRQYQVEVYEETAPTTPVGVVSFFVSGPLTSGEITHLTNGTAYFFRMRSANRAGAGTQSAPTNTVIPMETVTGEVPAGQAAVHP